MKSAISVAAPNAFAQRAEVGVVLDQDRDAKPPAELGRQIRPPGRAHRRRHPDHGAREVAGGAGHLPQRLPEDRRPRPAQPRARVVDVRVGQPAGQQRPVESGHRRLQRLVRLRDHPDQPGRRRQLEQPGRPPGSPGFFRGRPLGHDALPDQPRQRVRDRAAGQPGKRRQPVAGQSSVQVEGGHELPVGRPQRDHVSHPLSQ
jgi:hypothetical protein